MNSLKTLIVALLILWFGEGVQAATFSLGTSLMVEGPTAGQDSVILAASASTAAWKASSNASWLSVTKGSASGAGNATVLFSYSLNTGTARTGTLTVAGQTLTIVQAGAGYSAAGTLRVAQGFSDPSGVALDSAGNL